MLEFLKILFGGKKNSAALKKAQNRAHFSSTYTKKAQNKKLS